MSEDNKVGGLFKAEMNSDLQVFENHAYRLGYRYIAGIDEAGRGALAGPVVAAAVIFPKEIEIRGINDSKKLTSTQRENLFDIILDKSIGVGVGIVEHYVIDEINILQAALLSMKKAVLDISFRPDYLLIDGNCTIPVNLPQKAIVKGDSSSLSIAAASIIAKVTRDRLMIEYGDIYQGYGFAKHKGYGCLSHLHAIAELGPCEIHRKSFRGVKEHVSTKNCDLLFGTSL